MPEEIWNKRTGKEVQKGKHDLFERTVLPYLNSGYNLARWLTRNQHDAEDVIQEASLRAWRSFDTFLPGRDARAWFLAIVRNTCHTWLRQNRPRGMATQLEDDSQANVASCLNPEAELISKLNSQIVLQGIEALSLDYGEILILRELEGLSYREIAQIIDIPLGTVMSRLSRARRELYIQLHEVIGEMRA